MIAETLIVSLYHFQHIDPISSLNFFFIHAENCYNIMYEFQLKKKDDYYYGPLKKVL